MNRFALSPDNPVRRRLFNMDPIEQAAIDNFANVLQEEAARTMTEKIQKWNFDFENEVPLQGQFEWIRCGEQRAYIDRFSASKNESVSVDIEVADERDDSEEELYDEDSKLIIIKRRNETTPGKQKGIEDEPLLNARRPEKTTNIFDKVVRRNINFE